MFWKIIRSRLDLKNKEKVENILHKNHLFFKCCFTLFIDHVKPVRHWMIKGQKPFNFSDK